jgi:outer membrane murein-binding lipoprotein Lpp
MKKVFTFAVVAGMLSLAACSGNAEATEETTETTVEEVNVEVEEAFDAAAEEVVADSSATDSTVVEEAHEGHDHAEGESH